MTISQIVVASDSQLGDRIYGLGNDGKVYQLQEGKWILIEE